MISTAFRAADPPIKIGPDTWRLRSPAVGALLTLSVLLAKALVCMHASERAVFFDAAIFVPISMIAFNNGLALGTLVGLAASAVDLVLGSEVTGAVVFADYLRTQVHSATFITRTLSIECVAIIVAMLSTKARAQVARAEEQVEQYLSKLELMKEHASELQRTAEAERQQFEQSKLKSETLLHLLETSTQKIYSNLEADRLYEALFRVLEECFGATACAVYSKALSDGSYGLAATDTTPDIAPQILSHDDPLVRGLESARHAICWRETNPESPVTISGIVLEDGEPAGLIHVYTTDGSVRPDSHLMTMVCNIASIAIVNARLFGEVQWLAKRDPLTGLYNRRSLHNQLAAQTIARTTVGNVPEPFSVLMLDIDHFKSFNDTYGHQAGDAVIEWFARLCEKTAGTQNPVFRYGGEEFVIIMPHGNAESAVRLAERIRSLAESDSFNYEGQELTLTVSCGIAIFPTHSTDQDELLRLSDNALYKAKNNGRNTVYVSDKTEDDDTAFVPYSKLAISLPAKQTH